MANCLIGLGSNLGDRGDTIRAAIEQLHQLPQTTLITTSGFCDTRPVGGPAQQRYLNAAARIDTSLAPERLLAELQRIECQLGRVRDERWGPRTIDLDLLLYDELELNAAKQEVTYLEIPHPRMAIRRFVLEPAAEIAGEMIYPINRWSVSRLLAHLNTPNRQIAIAPSRTDQCQVDSAARLLAELAYVPRVQTSFRGKDPFSAHKPGEWLIADYWSPQEHFERRVRALGRGPVSVADLEFNFPIEFPDLKLVVVWSDEIRSTLNTERLEFLRHASRCGPVLWLLGRSLDQARQEVIAAMAAME